MTNPDIYDKPIKKQRYHLANKGPSSQSYGFSNSHVWIWEVDHKEGCVLNNWCFQIVVLKKTLESPFNSKEIKPVNPKGDQPWIFIGRTDDEAEVPRIWPPIVKNRLVWKKLWCWGRLKAGEGHDRGWDVGWHHWLNGLEYEQTQGDSEETWGAAFHGVARKWIQLAIPEKHLFQLHWLRQSLWLCGSQQTEENS